MREEFETPFIDFDSSKKQGFDKKMEIDLSLDLEKDKQKLESLRKKEQDLLDTFRSVIHDLNVESEKSRDKDIRQYEKLRKKTIDEFKRLKDFYFFLLDRFDEFNSKITEDDDGYRLSEVLSRRIVKAKKTNYNTDTKQFDTVFEKVSVLEHIQYLLLVSKYYVDELDKYFEKQDFDYSDSVLKLDQLLFDQLNENISLIKVYLFDYDNKDFICDKADLGRFLIGIDKRFAEELIESLKDNDVSVAINSLLKMKPGIEIIKSPEVQNAVKEKVVDLLCTGKISGALEIIKLFQVLDKYIGEILVESCLKILSKDNIDNVLILSKEIFNNFNNSKEYLLNNTEVVKAIKEFLIKSLMNDNFDMEKVKEFILLFKVGSNIINSPEIQGVANKLVRNFVINRDISQAQSLIDLFNVKVSETDDKETQISLQKKIVDLLVAGKLSEVFVTIRLFPLSFEVLSQTVRVAVTKLIVAGSAKQALEVAQSFKIPLENVMASVSYGISYYIKYFEKIEEIIKLFNPPKHIIINAAISGLNTSEYRYLQERIDVLETLIKLGPIVVDILKGDLINRLKEEKIDINYFQEVNESKLNEFYSKVIISPEIQNLVKDKLESIIRGVYHESDMEGTIKLFGMSDEFLNSTEFRNALKGRLLKIIPNAGCAFEFIMGFVMKRVPDIIKDTDLQNALKDRLIYEISEGKLENVSIITKHLLSREMQNSDDLQEKLKTEIVNRLTDVIYSSTEHLIELRKNIFIREDVLNTPEIRELIRKNLLDILHNPSNDVSDFIETFNVPDDIISSKECKDAALFGLRYAFINDNIKPEWFDAYINDTVKHIKLSRKELEDLYASVLTEINPEGYHIISAWRIIYLLDKLKLSIDFFKRPEVRKAAIEYLTQEIICFNHYREFGDEQKLIQGFKMSKEDVEESVRNALSSSLMDSSYYRSKAPDIIKDYNPSSETIKEAAKERLKKCLNQSYVEERILTGIINQYAPGSYEILYSKEIQDLLYDTLIKFIKEDSFHDIKNMIDILHNYIDLNNPQFISEFMKLELNKAKMFLIVYGNLNIDKISEKILNLNKIIPFDKEIPDTWINKIIPFIISVLKDVEFDKQEQELSYLYEYIKKHGPFNRLYDYKIFRDGIM